MFGLSNFPQTGVQSSAKGVRRRRTASSRRPFFRPSIEGLEVRIAPAATTTTTTLASDINPSVFGQTVTFTATVAAVAPGTGTPTVAAVAPGTGTPTGKVQFVIDGTNFGAPVALDTTGTASIGDSIPTSNGLFLAEKTTLGVRVG
ncbi:MAG: Ig-like domain repeat protein [Planctomycetaceae bacterium]|nr:Ig-like domain repeat protein [Planctomycetaceae bacterium]